MVNLSEQTTALVLSYILEHIRRMGKNVPGKWSAEERVHHFLVELELAQWRDDDVPPGSTQLIELKQDLSLERLEAVAREKADAIGTMTLLANFIRLAKGYPHGLSVTKSPNYCHEALVPVMKSLASDGLAVETPDGKFGWQDAIAPAMYSASAWSMGGAPDEEHGDETERALSAMPQEISDRLAKGSGVLSATSLVRNHWNGESWSLQPSESPEKPSLMFAKHLYEVWQRRKNGG